MVQTKLFSLIIHTENKFQPSIVMTKNHYSTSIAKSPLQLSNDDSLTSCDDEGRCLDRPMLAAIVQWFSMLALILVSKSRISQTTTYARIPNTRKK